MSDCCFCVLLTSAVLVAIDCSKLLSSAKPVTSLKSSPSTFVSSDPSRCSVESLLFCSADNWPAVTHVKPAPVAMTPMAACGNTTVLARQAAPLVVPACLAQLSPLSVRSLTLHEA